MDCLEEMYQDYSSKATFAANQVNEISKKLKEEEYCLNILAKMGSSRIGDSMAVKEWELDCKIRQHSIDSLRTNLNHIEAEKRYARKVMEFLKETSKG